VPGGLHPVRPVLDRESLVVDKPLLVREEHALRPGVHGPGCPFLVGPGTPPLCPLRTSPSQPDPKGVGEADPGADHRSVDKAVVHFPGVDEGTHPPGQNVTRRFGRGKASQESSQDDNPSDRLHV